MSAVSTSAVLCPYCSARPAEACVTMDGFTARAPHKSRVQYARQVAARAAEGQPDFRDDYSNPDFLRGQEDGVRGAVMVLRRVLDGQDPGGGATADTGLEQVRREVLRLRELPVPVLRELPVPVLQPDTGAGLATGPLSALWLWVKGLFFPRRANT